MKLVHLLPLFAEAKLSDMPTADNFLSTMFKYVDKIDFHMIKHHDEFR